MYFTQLRVADAATRDATYTAGGCSCKNASRDGTQPSQASGGNKNSSVSSMLRHKQLATLK
jgi:hypothetical protein